MTGADTPLLTPDNSGLGDNAVVRQGRSSGGSDTTVCSGDRGYDPLVKDAIRLINNRQQQNGRRRGRGGQRQGGGGNGREMGNRIDNRARGNAPQLLEKYKTLARDAQQSGDRVLAEYYFQFADHYFRVLAESRARYEEANPQARRPQNYDDGFGEDDGDGDGFGNDGDPDASDDFEPQREQRPQAARPYRDGSDRQERQEREPRADRDTRSERETRPEREMRPDRDSRVPRDDRPAREPRPPQSGASRDNRPRQDDRGAPRRDYAGDRDRASDRTGDRNIDRIADRIEPDRTNGSRAQTNGSAPRDVDDGATLAFDVLPPAIGVIAEPLMGSEGEPVALPRRRGRPRKIVDAREAPVGED